MEAPAMKVRDLLTEYNPVDATQGATVLSNNAQSYADWCAEYDRINPTVRITTAEELLAEIRALRNK